MCFEILLSDCLVKDDMQLFLAVETNSFAKQSKKSLSIWGSLSVVMYEGMRKLEHHEFKKRLLITSDVVDDTGCASSNFVILSVKFTKYLWGDSGAAESGPKTSRCMRLNLVMPSKSRHVLGVLCLEILFFWHWRHSLYHNFYYYQLLAM